MRRAANGFTLVELAIAATVAAVVAGMAWPAHKAALAKARRADAVTALTRIELAQAQYQAANGIYASDLPRLRGAASALSPEGLYQLSLEDVGADRYTVVARARPGGPQATDLACPALKLRVEAGFAERLPSAACWGRG
jgi:type IV pilus assembly protein PilE